MIEWFGKFWVWVQNRLFELFNLVIVLAILYLFIRIVLLIVRWYGKARIVRAREDYRTTVNFIQANNNNSCPCSYQYYNSHCQLLYNYTYECLAFFFVTPIYNYYQSYTIMCLGIICYIYTFRYVFYY